MIKKSPKDWHPHREKGKVTTLDHLFQVGIEILRGRVGTKWLDEKPMNVPSVRLTAPETYDTSLGTPFKVTGGILPPQVLFRMIR